MKVGTFLSITGALGVLFGLGFLLAPEASLASYGVPVAPHNVMQARYFGTTLFAFGLVVWLLRNVVDPSALRGVLLANVVGNGLGAALSAWSALSGLQNALAWSSVVIYGAIALGALLYWRGAQGTAGSTGAVVH
jgi:hypothetical protein